MNTGRRRVWLGAALVAGVAAVSIAAPYVTAAAFLIDVSGQDVAWRAWLPVRALPVTTTDLEVPTRHGAIPGRLYQPSPASRSRRTVLVVPGLHTAGVEEPRLARLSARLAGEGMRVLSLPLPDLRQLLVTTRSTDMIEDAAVWLASQPDLAPAGRISIFGISFGGGLSVVAAGRPSLADRLDAVVSFGGHGDLPRVLRYFSTGLLPDGTPQPAHDYGVVIFLLGALPHLVPADLVAPLELAVRTFLDASMIDVEAPDRAARQFDEAARLGRGLPDPARDIMADVSARDGSRLGPRLAALAEQVGGDPALSPERSPVTRAPVFLIHGAVDTVIPQTETASLAAFLDRSPERRGHPAHWLISPAITHANTAGHVSPGDAWALVRMWAEMTR